VASLGEALSVRCSGAVAVNVSRCRDISSASRFHLERTSVREGDVSWPRSRTKRSDALPAGMRLRGPASSSSTQVATPGCSRTTQPYGRCPRSSVPGAATWRHERSRSTDPCNPPRPGEAEPGQDANWFDSRTHWRTGDTNRLFKPETDRGLRCSTSASPRPRPRGGRHRRWWSSGRPRAATPLPPPRCRPPRRPRRLAGRRGPGRPRER
jgi:hypothetical protein